MAENDHGLPSDFLELDLPSFSLLVERWRMYHPGEDQEEQFVMNWALRKLDDDVYYS